MTAVSIKNVLVLYVGGTIGMKKNAEGVYVPVPKEFFQRLKNNAELHDPEAATKFVPNIKENQLVLPPIDTNVVVYEMKEYDPLLDSSNIGPSDWVKMAKDLQKNYDNFDGFLILHGTDTLCYTASALSFMVKGLKKPIILTGAQVSIFESRTDAIDNILSSLILSGCYKIPEVCILFFHKLIRGNRAIKFSVEKFDAFQSPNYAILGNTETSITLNDYYIMKPSSEPFSVNLTLNANVGLFTFFPTVTPPVLKCFFDQPFDGVVLQTYGAGNMPSNQTELINILKNAVNRGVLIVNVTVCPQGTVFSIYETGKVLEDIGVISGYDMTPEAALTKLCAVLSFTDMTLDEKKQLMKENICGELTIPSKADKK